MFPEEQGWGKPNQVVHDPYTRWATEKEREYLEKTIKVVPDKIHFCETCCKEIPYKTEEQMKRHILSCNYENKNLENKKERLFLKKMLKDELLDEIKEEVRKEFLGKTKKKGGSNAKS